VQLHIGKKENDLRGFVIKTTVEIHTFKASYSYKKGIETAALVFQKKVKGKTDFAIREL
jgi:hypothetical protein